MVQQWFLDLDGVRSGPYQTPEVLGLIAEGEVLPHHRISTSLKDHPWTTILEWRLEQAKHEPPAKRSYLPQGEAKGVAPPPKAYEFPWKEPPKTEPAVPLSQPSPEVAAVEIHPVVTPKKTDDATPDEIEEVIQVLKPEPKPEPVPPAPTPAVPAAPPPAATPAEAAGPEKPSDAPAPRKRDPMSEMFDIIQTTRQKREARERSSHSSSSSAAGQVAPAHERHDRAHAPPSSGSWMRTAAIGLLITLAGFFLGQYFQQESAPPPEASTADSETPAAPKPVKTEPSPVMRTEVIDRSTDKMTIRAQVQKPVNEPAPAAPTLQDKRELQELRDLKKELQELKALKEELKNTPTRIDDGSDIPPDANYLNPPGYNEGYGEYEADPGYSPYEPSPNDAIVEPGTGGLPPPPQHSVYPTDPNY